MFYFKFEKLISSLNIDSKLKGLVFQDLFIHFFNSKDNIVKQNFIKLLKSLNSYQPFDNYFNFINSNSLINEQAKHIENWIIRSEENKFSELSDLRFAPKNSKDSLELSKSDKIGFLFDIKLSENWAKEHLNELINTNTKYFNYLLGVIYPWNKDKRMKLKFYQFLDTEIDIEFIFENDFFEEQFEIIKICQEKQGPFFKENDRLEDVYFPHNNNFYFNFWNYNCFWNIQSPDWKKLMIKLLEEKKYYLLKINEKSKYCNLI